jgi:hypothetical protein
LGKAGVAMDKMIVRLDDDTVGTCYDIGATIGDNVMIKIHDENGNSSLVRGNIVEILE